MTTTDTTTTDPKLCPCQSEKLFKDCCEPYIEGKAAPTPESLMRSRYTAFTLNNMDYIENTMQGPALKRHLKDKAERENEPDLPPLEWVGLNILETTMDDSSTPASSGTVRFNAFYRFNNRASQITENSVFKLIDGRWYYFDVKDLKQAALKVGRNDQCPCGSGKKYKKCCGQN